MKTSRFIWLVLPLVLLGVDLASKVAVVLTVPLHGTLVVIPGFFNLTVNHNYGAIFGSISDSSALFRAAIFGVTGIFVISYFGWELLRVDTPVIQRIALGLILGGVLGNSFDRLQYGFVVDFLDFVFWGWHYWTFNLADSFILCGTILLLAFSFKFSKKSL
jgi:signal peptidase II